MVEFKSNANSVMSNISEPSRKFGVSKIFFNNITENNVISMEDLRRNMEFAKVPILSTTYS